VAGGHDASFEYHRRMLDDDLRMDAFERAIRAVVRPGDVVLDLGAGTGVLAMLAARCGAARVHAVESMGVARVARELVAANGFADRIVVHEADAITMAPVEAVDVVVSDFLGCFLVDDGMLDAVAAAARWLKPQGRFVPEAVRLLVAPFAAVPLPAVDIASATMYGLDLRTLEAGVLRRSYRGDLDPTLLLAAPRAFLDYRPPALDEPFGRELSFTAAAAGRLRGFAGWFEARLAPGVTLTNAPGAQTHWGQALFPVATRAVAAGDELRFRLRARDARLLELEWSVEGGAPDEPSPAPDGDLEDLGAAAFHAGRFDDARRLWSDAIRALDARDPRAAPIYENLGIACLHAGRPAEAARALLRALDGDPRAREQSLRLLVGAMYALGRHADEERYRRIYEETFGKLR
jgi:SAM-dependent methyltransferase